MCMQIFNAQMCFGKAVQILIRLLCWVQFDPYSIFKQLEILVKLVILS